MRAVIKKSHNMSLKARYLYHREDRKLSKIENVIIVCKKSDRCPVRHGQQRHRQCGSATVRGGSLTCGTWAVTCFF